MDQRILRTPQNENNEQKKKINLKMLKIKELKKRT